MSAQERLDLGTSYFKEGRFDKAIKALSSIRREEIAPEIYAGVQLGLGAAYYAQKDLEQAIEALSSIRRDDDSKTYAWAQIGLGIAYNKSGKLDEAIKIWSNIRHDDDPKAYAQAQLNLGAVYYAQEDLDQAIKTWSNIRSEEADPETYAQAQLGLGTAYAESGKPEQAIKTWSNINREEVDPETYVEAQLGLGEVYSLDKETEEQSHKAYDNVRDFSYYKFERGFKILKCPVELRKELHSLAKNTDEVLKYLQIIPGFESKVAHYTRPQIAFDLFEDKKNDKDKEPSNFRLSTIRGVNDPTEGLVLNGYWNQQGIPETIHANDTATFISCFTFNHDSLNQFRLYGK